MGKMSSDQPPRLVFKQLNGFQAIDNQGKVKTILFLDASREVVTIIGKFVCFLFLATVVIISSKCIERKKKQTNIMFV